MFTISPVTAQQIALLKVALAMHGTAVEAITPTTTPGKYQISGHGMLATALFDAGDSTLVVKVIKKPFFVREESIEDGLADELAALAPPAQAAPVVDPPPVPAGTEPAAA
jgi:hypothetical protein